MGKNDHKWKVIEIRAFYDGKRLVKGDEHLVKTKKEARELASKKVQEGMVGVVIDKA